MTEQEVTQEAMRGLSVLREAVREELERKAKLGQQAVVCDPNGKVKIVSAKYLIRKMREANKDDALTANESDYPKAAN